MAMSWHTMMEFEPPLVGCVISGRNHSFGALEATGECVLNIPTRELALRSWAAATPRAAASTSSRPSASPRAPASVVGPPLIAECYANLECKVVDTRMVPKYNFFVLQVLKAWIDPTKKEPRTLHHRGRGAFMVAGRTIQLPSKAK